MKYFVGIFFIVFAIINARRTRREISEGETHLVVTAGGDGLLGHADRAQQPFFFWLNISVHLLVEAAAAAGGLWLLLGPADF